MPKGRFALCILHYLFTYGIRAKNLALLIASVKRLWCLAQVPVSRADFIFAQGVRYLESILASLKSITSIFLRQKLQCLLVGLNFRGMVNPLD